MADLPEIVMQRSTVTTVGKQYRVTLVLADQYDPETAENTINASLLIASSSESPTFLRLQAAALRRMQDVVSAAYQEMRAKLDRLG